MIVDTHVHFYDPTRPQGIPWPNRSNGLLYRTVLPGDFRAVASPHGVAATVVVEASPWLEDNQWILDLAARESVICGFVGNLDPESPDFVAHLDRFAASPLFRGIRARRGGILKTDLHSVVGSLKALADRDLSLDLLVNAEHLPMVAAVAGEVPGLRIVLNHTAHVPVDGKAPDPSGSRA